MSLDAATSDYYEARRALDRSAAQRAQEVAVRDATRAGVVDYWRAMPRPYAVVTRTEPNRTHPGHYVVTIQCPYCGQEHSHGWAGPGTPGGHRAAHCTGPLARAICPRGYVLVIPSENIAGADR